MSTYLILNELHKLIKHLFINFSKIRLVPLKQLNNLIFLKHGDILTPKQILLKLDQYPKFLILPRNLLGAEIATTSIKNMAERVNDANFISCYFHYVFDCGEEDLAL